ncbi:MAG: AmmeMemoRadiSam system protein B [Patescibacteria group bacterium]
MSLVFSAFTPHPPLIVPSIGKTELKKLSKTSSAFKELERNLYAAQPEVILIISPHGSFFPDVFTVNSCVKYTADFKDFGDLETSCEFNGDFEMTHRLRDATKRKHFPATLISEPRLDHGSSVPLIMLAGKLTGAKIVQLGFCDLDFKTHLDFGALIKEQILLSNRRVAVIASGDMSHALSTDAPAGFNKAGAEFDKKIRELLMAGNISGILNLDEKLIKNASECGLRSLLILLGILQKMHYDYRELAYEAPFGVGYLTAEFI